MTNDRLELIGLGAMGAGSLLVSVALGLVTLWAGLLVAGLMLLAAGLAVVALANRGGAA